MKVYWIERRDQIEALSSPTRQDIADRLGAVGPCTVAVLAQAMLLAGGRKSGVERRSRRSSARWECSGRATMPRIGRCRRRLCAAPEFILRPFVTICLIHAGRPSDRPFRRPARPRRIASSPRGRSDLPDARVRRALAMYAAGTWSDMALADELGLTEAAYRAER